MPHDPPFGNTEWQGIMSVAQFMVRLPPLTLGLTEHPSVDSYDEWWMKREAGGFGGFGMSTADELHLDADLVGHAMLSRVH